MHGTRLFVARRVETLAPAQAPASVEAFVTVGERVAATGRVADLRRRFPDAEPVDLGEAVVVPGFNDAHQHPSIVAADLLYLDLSPEAAPSLEAIRRSVAEQARRLPAGQWIRGSRYDDAKLPDARPLSRDDLDRAAPDHPVVVTHVSVHWGVANSAALRAAGLDDASPAPPGGELGRDAAGRLDGILRERAFFGFAVPSLGGPGTVVPTPPLDDWLTGLDRVQDQLAAAGITSVTDALAGPGELELFQEARRRCRLRLRVNLLLTHRNLAALQALGVGTGFGDERLRIGGIKVILDGSVSAGTCLLDEPLKAEAGHGWQLLEAAALREVVGAAQRDGLRLAVHANGDRAIGMVLDELEAAAARWPRPGLRHRIEHCSVVTPRIVERMARLGAIAVPFGAYVSFHGDKLLERYGDARLERMFANRMLLDGGVTVAGSSDHPCGPFEPLQALRDCVTRRTRDGRLLGGSQRIRVEEALRLYTVGSAEASGEADLKGRLAPGFLADFAVLGADPLAVAPEELASVPVLATYAGARRIWPRGDPAG